MAKTIKELAHQYVYEHCDNDKHAITMQCAYEAGANAVLEEIESCLGEFYSPDDYTNVKNKIKELRGYGKGLE